MATPVTSTSAQPPPETELSLTGVTVAFLGKRPKKIKLTITLDGKEYAGEIDLGGSVRWQGAIRGMAGTKISIHAQCPHRRPWMGWKDFASAEGSLTEHPSAIPDVKGRISVMLTVTPLHGENARSVGSNARQDLSKVPRVEASDDVPQISKVREAVNAANEKVANKTVIVDKLGKIWPVLKIVDAIGESLKDIHPAVGMAVTAVGSLMKLCDMQKGCRDEASNLVEQLMSFLSIEAYIDTLKKRTETRRAVGVMLELISDASNYICEKTSTGVRGIIGDLIGSEYREKINRLQKEFARAKKSFDRSVQLEIFVAVDGIEMTTEFLFIHEKLLECDNAHFKSDRGCLDGTRGDLRRRLKKWIDDTDADQVFWLHGNVGSGKSTVANTLAKMVEDLAGGYYLSCFCCKRDDPDLSNPRRLLPTLAYRFAQQHESYRAVIMKLLRDATRGAGIATTADIKTQFERLFREPLKLTVDPLRPHVVVIDALDECGSSEEQKMLARYLVALSGTVPWVKVFVTSRDEPGIHQIFSQATNCILCNINDEKGTNDDIRVYIESQAKELDDPLTDADVAQLVQRADGLFIWCRTLFEYLRNGIGATSFLEQLLSGGQDLLPHPWSQLYMLYDKVLDSALGSQTPDAVSFMRSILLIVHVSARNRPLSVNAIMSFLHVRGLHTQFRVKDAEKVVKRLHSVLYIGTAVRAHHISFYDFLQWKANLSSESGWKTLGEIHALMAETCIVILKTDLKFNICKLDTPILTKDILDLAVRISIHIPETLQYSSRFWFTHFLPSTLTAAEVERDVLELLQSVKILFWLECSSLQGYLKQIQFTFRVCMQKFFQLYPAIIAAAEDVCRFVSYFADAMDSIPHIYLSALMWLPEDSLTYKNLVSSKKTNLDLIQNKRQNWDALVWTSGEIRMRSVIFSPDGRFVTCGGKYGDIYVRDSQTGALAGKPFQGHRNEVLSLAYSPDGHFIVSGSRDTIRIWNTESGETILRPLEGHSNTISCVAYSPDGHFIALGSYDCTIRIWNARSGELEGKPLLHPGSVTWVAYSPNGRFIASACDDRCVHVWDTSSRQEVAKPFRGHESRVWSVAYSPDGHSIVSGSRDKTIRVWDAQTGQAIGKPLEGHIKEVKSVVYSPDGRFILSGSDDRTMRLWDGTSHTPVGGPLQTHSGRVWCVSYSPDGFLIASASDAGVHVWDTSTAFVAGNQSQDPTVQTPIQLLYAVAYSPDGRFIASCIEHSDQIHIWNAQTGAPVDAPVLRHAGMGREGRIRAIAYSRDGRFIASGSDDYANNTVCVLDVETGATISGPLRGHSDCIWSVAYSPDGGYVASASQDGTLRLWNVNTNVVIGQTLQVGSPARSVAFSPDGRFLACSMNDGSVWIWDAHTKASIRAPIQAHSDRVHSITFSPDGRYIASGSHDHTVRIWDAQTGKAFGGPPQEHQDHVVCVAYSPDGRFIASSSYGEVIIWDVQSGLACGEPIQNSDWVWSVAYSPDGRFLAYGASDGKIYVHHVPNDRDNVEARWVQLCSHMNLEDGWIKDGKTLLLWVPVPYRKHIRSCVRFIVPNPTPNITAYSIDYKTLSRYSGRNWVHILSSLND